MAAPSTPVLDDFNTGANQLLTARAGWSASVQFTGDTSLTTDAVPTYAIASTAAEASNIWTLSAVDVEVFMVQGGILVGTSVVSTRLTGTGATLNGYELYWNVSTGNVTLFKIVGGVETSLGLIATQAMGIGDTMCLQSIGTSHQAWYKASGGSYVSLGAIVDSTYTGAGAIGLLVGSTTHRFEAFGGGALVTATFGPQFPRHIGPASMGFGKATV